MDLFSDAPHTPRILVHYYIETIPLGPTDKITQKIGLKVM